MNKIPAMAAAAWALAGVGLAQAQAVRSLEAGAAPAPATLDDFKGLVGNWEGPFAVAAFSPARNGQIVGHLFISNGPTPRMQEIWIVRPEGASVLTRQKHFTPDLKDREGQDQWTERRVVAIDPGHIYLENVTWVITPDSLTFMTRPAGQAGDAPAPPAATASADELPAGPASLNLTMKRVK
ncbi:MAG TPA: DUF6265 family protein [Caulobacteraceae bacterium]|jgi:hypothetical protein|nr:DUF6265 family protein [Caulobacteraceae bacterium]